MFKLVLFLWFVVFGLSACENATLPGNLIDGDILIGEHEDPWDRSFLHRGPLVDMKGKRWFSAIVPYEIDETAYNALDTYIIQEAQKVIESATCVKFVRRTSEHDYIYITPHGGCWSYVGRVGSKQLLSLVTPHCINKGTIIHELMHALGFWHEHSRSDRDEYIDILWENLKNKEVQENFVKLLPEALNFFNYSYDYRSVMHYDAYVFSKSPKLPTMKPKKPGVRLRDLGLAKAVGTLTELDKRKINILYECKGYGRNIL